MPADRRGAFHGDVLDDPQSTIAWESDGDETSEQAFEAEANASGPSAPWMFSISREKRSRVSVSAKADDQRDDVIEALEFGFGKRGWLNQGGSEQSSHCGGEFVPHCLGCGALVVECFFELSAEV
jgi:hypothetical protein